MTTPARPFFSYPPSAEADLMFLRARGAHLLVCSPIAWGLKKAKACKTPEWQKTPASSDAVHAAVTGGVLAGIVPASLDMTVIDVDGTPDEQAAGEKFIRAKLGKPLAAHNTHPEGGRHLWYRSPADGPPTNRKWYGPDGAHGEVRGTCGYVCAWDPAATRRAHAKSGSAERISMADVEAITAKQPLLEQEPEPEPSKTNTDAPAVLVSPPAPKKKPRRGMRDLSLASLAKMPPGSGRNDRIYDIACDMRYRLDGDGLEESLNELRTVAAQIGHDAARTEATIASAAKSDRAAAGKNGRTPDEKAGVKKPRAPRAKKTKPKPAAEPHPPPDPDAPIKSEYDLGNLYLARNDGRLRYVVETQDYRRWADGDGWNDLAADVVTREIMALGKEVYRREKGGKDVEAPTVGGRRNTALGAAGAVRGATHIRTAADHWDANPKLVGIPGGRLLEVQGRDIAERDAKPEDMITRRLAAAPAPEEDGYGSGPWADHLMRVFDGHPDLIDFLQVLMGYALVGAGGRKILLLARGDRDTLKSTTFDILARAFGSYASRPDREAVIAHRIPQHPTSRMAFLGRRLSVVGELDEGDRLDSSFIKRLTGGAVDTVSARAMRQDEIQFVFRGLPIIQTNFEPKAHSPDPALHKRVRVLPFRNVIPDSEAIPNFAATVPPEHVVGWCVDGARRLLAEPEMLADRKMPADVRNASRQWAKEADSISQFVTEMCELGRHDTHRVYARDAFNAYGTWADRTGNKYRPSQQGLTKKLEHGFPGVVNRHGERGARLDGIRIRPDAES